MSFALLGDINILTLLAYEPKANKTLKELYKVILDDYHKGNVDENVGHMLLQNVYHLDKMWDSLMKTETGREHIDYKIKFIMDTIPKVRDIERERKLAQIQADFYNILTLGSAGMYANLERNIKEMTDKPILPSIFPDLKLGSLVLPAIIIGGLGALYLWMYPKIKVVRTITGG